MFAAEKVDPEEQLMMKRQEIFAVLMKDIVVEEGGKNNHMFVTADWCQSVSIDVN